MQASVGWAYGWVTRAVTWAGATRKGKESWQGFPKSWRGPPAWQGKKHA